MALPLAVIWSQVAQQVTSGLAAGSIYASLALALVLIYQTTNVVNFAQGEMATFTTFIAWTIMNHGVPYWPAFALTLLIAFGGGVTVERVLIRPVEHRPELVIVILTIGMLIAINGLTGWIWGPEVKAFDSPFPNRSVIVGGVAISIQDIGTFCICLGTVAVLWVFFRFTTLGLAMRSVAFNPDASRLMGVRVGWMLALGWGFAAALGAVAGMMAAPTVFLDPDMMLVVLIYAFAAAVLGGIDSPVGAVVGGLTARGRDQPARQLRRLRRPGAQTADSPGSAAARARDPAEGPLRSRRGAKSLMRRWILPTLQGLVLAAAVVLIALLPRFTSEFRLGQFTYVGDLLHRAARSQHPHGIQRPDLARTWRLHGDRRLYGSGSHPRPERASSSPVWIRRRSFPSTGCARSSRSRSPAS